MGVKLPLEFWREQTLAEGKSEKHLSLDWLMLNTSLSLEVGSSLDKN
jgi:hypothetical protein